jgi:UDPglucose 6-dehydrogenase
VRTARENGYEMRILQSVEDVNDDQKSVLFNKLTKRFGTDLKGKKFAFWGLSFKPNTDDMREAPSLVLVEKIKAAGGEVIAYDPVAMKETRHMIGDAIQYAKDEYDAVVEVDALLLITEWAEFRSPNLKVLKKLLKNPIIFDGRNIYDAEELQKEGFEYYGIGVKPTV